MTYKEHKVKQVYFKMSEVVDILKLPGTSIIRFWQKEVDIRMGRNKAGHRRLTEDDVKKLAIVKYMIQVERYTLDGVKLNFNKYECDDELNVKRVKL